jgi:hypothetical protein
MKYVTCILDEGCSNDVVIPHQVVVNSTKFSFYVALDPLSYEDLTWLFKWADTSSLLAGQSHLILAWLFHFEAIPVAQTNRG